MGSGRKAAAAAAVAVEAAESPSGSGSRAVNAVVTKRAVFNLSLHPSAVADASRGARELLDGMLMRHHDQLGGVLMGYSDEKIVGTDARIVHMAGYVSVRVAAKAKVFCPKVGSKLRGRVNKVGVDFIGLLVLDVFNASVAAADIAADLIHNPVDFSSPGGCWESAEDGGRHRIGVGTDVVFIVKAVSEYDDVLHLIGSLAEEGTGAASHVDPEGDAAAAVSYTHLTLPTICSV